MDVVDVAVAVVVDAVARDLAEVRPDVRREVGVVEPRAGVDDRDDDARALRESAHAPGRSSTVPGATAHCSPCSASAVRPLPGPRTQAQPYRRRPGMGSGGGWEPPRWRDPDPRPRCSSASTDRVWSCGAHRCWSAVVALALGRACAGAGRCASRRPRIASPTRAAGGAEVRIRTRRVVGLHAADRRRRGHRGARRRRSPRWRSRSPRTRELLAPGHRHPARRQARWSTPTASSRSSAAGCCAAYGKARRTSGAA